MYRGTSVEEYGMKRIHYYETPLTKQCNYTHALVRLVFDGKKTYTVRAEKRD